MKRLLPILVWISYSGLIGWIHFRNDLLWWSLGVLLAVGLFFLDRCLYVWWLNPYEQLSIQIHYWWQKHDYWAVLKMFIERGSEQSRLVLKSGGFVLVWPLLAIYMLTSTGSVIASGIIMGLGLGLVMAIVTDWRDLSRLKSWLCWQIKREVSDREVHVVAGTFVLLWGLITVMVK